MPVRGPRKQATSRGPESSAGDRNWTEPISAPSSEEKDGSIEEFLAALKRPFEFLGRNPAAAERTSVPAGEFARRARSLAERADEKRRGLLDSLRDCLEQYVGASTEDRFGLARRCLTLIEQLGGAGGAMVAGEVGGERREVSYRASQGDLARAIEELARPVRFVRGVGPRRAEVLRKFGILTVEDLLYHLPFRYEDRRRVRKVIELRVGETASVIGEFTQVSDRTVGRARRRILEAVLRDETGLLSLTWYNQVAYFRSRFRVGQRCLVHGRVERAAGATKRIVHPEVDLHPDDEGQGILPVYNKPTTITVAAMRKLVQQAVRDFAPYASSVLPRVVAQEAGLSDLETAMRELHVPRADADVADLETFSSTAHRSLVFDELFYLHLGMLLRRRAAGRERGVVLARRGHLTDRFEQLLPFTLTAAQSRVIGEVCRDMAQPHPMNRLVQGDVGSGKTMVALFAALIAIENDYQAAFMAPTELLAEQHFTTMGRFLEDLGVQAVLLTGDATRSERKRVCAGLAEGTIQLAVGTHALIQEDVRFKSLGFGVIDEQHRFGVLQRAALRGVGEHAVTPDILLMTATPIPRTLAMTVYGDLDVSAIDELPPGRLPVRTLLVNEAERQRVVRLVKEELERGRQAYIVYPLVESSEKEDLRDATTMAEELSRTVFRDYRVGLVHGRMKADEKDAVMRRFRAGDLQLLVSTTVIEVGVDVPNATIMVIEHAERFGLSQLHQLRGRVGRGDDRATCVLVAPYRRVEDVYRRLKAMVETNDGFRIAEIDLEMRGPGEFLGTRQSGLPDFRVANLLRDSRLLAEANRLAEAWLDEDPNLEGPDSLRMRAVLQARWAGRLGLAEIG